mmetsp:Transcript_24067/g.49180  ORF Transcript_24067/g.49180 Transcript_24067/m.49180 type:complete len:930 (+) Transcript_24067:134-2923(+)
MSASNRRSRMSLGGNVPSAPSALQDVSSRSNRRTSFGGMESPAKGEPKKDRRAMLDEWRKARGRSPARLPPMAPSSSSADSRMDHEKGEATIELPLPPVPPSAPPASTASATSSVSSVEADKENQGMTALERYRLRRQARANDGGEPTISMSLGTPTRNRLPPHPSSSSASSFVEDEETATIGYSSITAGTPSRRPKARRSLSCGGAQRKVRRRTMGLSSEQVKPKPLLPPSYPFNQTSATNDEADPVEPSKAELNTEPEGFSYGGMDSVEGAAMKSRIQAMQKRIDNLEREKMELSMSKAPLEARMRQKEDAWSKERERLLAEIETCQQASKEADERYRELEMRNEELNEEAKKFRFEQARAAVSSSDGKGETDSWSERLKTNREITQLREELKSKEDEIKSLRIEKVSLESEVYGCQTEIQTLERNYDELSRDYEELQSSKSQNTEAEIQLQALATEHTAMTAQLNATNADLEETRSRAKADLQAKEENWKERESELLFEISVLKTRAKKAEVCNTSIDISEGEEDAAILKARIEERDRKIRELEDQLLKGEQLRRAMHNRIQELRGNIRVFVRTRPFLPNDGPAANSSIDIMSDGESLMIQGNREAHGFKFDKVFAPSAGQDAVFDEVSEFVQSALDGYHVCLFSYGQTGSGKSHTIVGSGNGAMRGIIPRAVEQILAQAELMQNQRWKFTMKASFLEIYNEDLRDLLVMMNPNGTVRTREARTTKKLSIKRNAEGKSFVEGLNMVTIDVENKSMGLEQLEAVMAAAARARSVAATKMNAQSSRSHSVFMLHLCGRNEESGTVVQGALNLCDLAGSERLDRSGASSDVRRLKETQAINKSLSALGDVFAALASGSKHIPFRNSKLTYLLQDCLSGDGKALMFVNLSPTLESSHESLCSLRFAERVNQVELGRAIKHVQYSKGTSKK